MSPTKLSGTILVHGDHDIAPERREVAPSISVTSTFKAIGPDERLDNIDMKNPDRHVYSRYTQDVSTRAEHILGKITGGHALTYASGLAAAYAALVFFKPKRIAIKNGYFGCHASIEVYSKAKENGVELIDLDADYQPGDLCWLETPLNPTGEVRDIAYYAAKIHKVGGKLLVDATFAPPPLLDPFKWGADLVFHSGTKYFGGHSDLLAGIILVKTLEEWTALQHDRTYLGSTMGSLEAWLLLRSLRTLHLRVARQSQTATELVQWLQAVASTPAGKSYDGVPGGILVKVWHSSLQGVDSRGFDPKTQMEGGWNATFAIQLATVEQARVFPYETKNFIAATSLGGVESLIEYRARADVREDPRLIRLSVGIEELEDLKAGLREGLIKVSQVKSKL